MNHLKHLFILIQQNKNEQVKELLLKHSVDTIDEFKRTPLLNAALYGNLELINWLLDQVANIHHQDKNGYTALHFSVQQAHTKVSQKLIAKGANVNHQDRNGNTPAWVAVLNWGGGKNFDNLKLLISYNANLSLKNKAGKSTLELIPFHIKSHLGIKSPSKWNSFVQELKSKLFTKK